MELTLPTAPFLISLPQRPATRRGIGGTFLDPAWPSKDPAETRDYAVDFAWVFDGDTPTVVATVIPANAVEITDQDMIGTAIVMRISGGQDGVAALIEMAATSTNGEVALRTVTLPIVSVDVAGTCRHLVSPQPPPPPA